MQLVWSAARRLLSHRSRTRPLPPCSSPPSPLSLLPPPSVALLHHRPLLASGSMYTARLYGTTAGGGGGGDRGGGGAKPGRRLGGVSLSVVENPHHPHHQHHHPPPPAAFPVYQSRPEAQHHHHHTRPAHFHHHHHYTPQPPHPHLSSLPPHPPPPHHHPPHYHHPPHHHHQHYSNAAPSGGPLNSSQQQHQKKKTWNFIHEKMSYDTFFTMKRLIERSRQPDEVLRWLTQNPGKISHNHYPIALQKIGQLLQSPAPPPGAPPAPPAPRSDGGTADGSDIIGEEPEGRPVTSWGPVTTCGDITGEEVLDAPDFHTLCDSIVQDCSKFDNFSIVNCLYAVAALGLPSESRVVEVLESESQSRLAQFNQKDLSMVFSASVRLHPGVPQHPLTEACLAGLERNLERERHPQTLFLLLSYYRLKWHALQEQASGGAKNNNSSSNSSGGGSSPAPPPNPEQLLANRKILRLVKHTLASVSGVRDQEMVLLDEMLAACAREASNKSLEVIFSSHLFYQNRQERFIYSLAEELPKKVDSVTPFTMALISKYMARHRLRETRLLDCIAEFLVKKADYLDSKVIQKLVFPFSRMWYRPSNQVQFFSKLESVLEQKALSSPLATVNILMSLFQLGHFPGPVLNRVFSTAFISNVTNSPYALIVRRYLSLLDAAIELEYQDYTGPRLQEQHKVLMFDHALTADEVNRKYSYKGLVAEALRQLVGEHSYKQDEVLAPGYYTDFLLWLDGCGRVLPVRPGGGGFSLAGLTPPPPVEGEGPVTVATLTSDFHKFSPFSEESPPGGPSHLHKLSGPNGSGAVVDYSSYYASPHGSEYYPGLNKDPSVESQDSSTLSSPPSDSLMQGGAAGPGLGGATASGGPGHPAGSSGGDSLFQFSIGHILEEQGPPGVGPPDLPGGFYEGGASPGSPPQEDHPPTEHPRHVKRVILSVNDKWHYCHNSDVLVGSRAMRDRHLALLGYHIVQLPYHELEKLNGIEEVKQYLHKKLLDLPL